MFLVAVKRGHEKEKVNSENWAFKLDEYDLICLVWGSLVKSDRFYWWILDYRFIIQSTKGLVEKSKTLERFVKIVLLPTRYWCIERKEEEKTFRKKTFHRGQNLVWEKNRTTFCPVSLKMRNTGEQDYCEERKYSFLKK